MSCISMILWSNEFCQNISVSQTVTHLARDLLTYLLTYPTVGMRDYEKYESIGKFFARKLTYFFSRLRAKLILPLPGTYLLLFLVPGTYLLLFPTLVPTKLILREC